MKKTLFTVVLALVSVIAINAQSLTGKQWCTMLGDEDGESVAVALTFNNNGTCELLIAAQQEMKEDGVPITLVAGLTVPGTYTRKDKDLRIALNNAKAEAEIDYEVKGLNAKAKAALDKEIRPSLKALEGEFKKEMLKEMPKMDNMKIVTLENQRLILKDSTGAKMTFYAEK